MNRVFVIGDIHGAYLALRQCLKRSDFDHEKDQLICLGDVADGWPQTKECVDELLRINHLTYILGNHDWWTLQWMLTGEIEDTWYRQGGKATIDSYRNGVPEAHLAFFSGAQPYFLYDNKLFVHAGIDPSIPLEKQNKNTLLWDRSLASFALERYPYFAEGRLSTFDEIYIGHTPIPFDKPIRFMEIWLMDTGAGWSGVLSMMDINSKKMFISDSVPSLYPGIKGRKRRG
ncbi:MAG TPA: metallophosphoesterase [Chryseosolibacter sp.]